MSEPMNGDAFVLAAAAAAIQIARNRSTEELEFLAAFFDCLADNLALIALQRPEDFSGEDNNSSINA